VARWILGVLQKPSSQGAEMSVVEINGQPGLLGTVQGQPIGAVCLEVADDKIVAIRFIVNPDKLGGLS
jgi:RNA polymerase sigma-70 factor (ECF subfamily)